MITKFFDPMYKIEREIKKPENQRILKDYKSAEKSNFLNSLNDDFKNNPSLENVLNVYFGSDYTFFHTDKHLDNLKVILKHKKKMNRYLSKYDCKEISLFNILTQNLDQHISVYSDFVKTKNLFYFDLLREVKDFQHKSFFQPDQIISSEKFMNHIYAQIFPSKNSAEDFLEFNKQMNLEDTKFAFNFFSYKHALKIIPPKQADELFKDSKLILSIPKMHFNYKMNELDKIYS